VLTCLFCWLQSVARNGNNTAAWVRDYRATVFAASSVTIGVPNMGDSITEGEIAAIIKAPGKAHVSVPEIEGRDPLVSVRCAARGRVVLTGTVSLLTTAR